MRRSKHRHNEVVVDIRGTHIEVGAWDVERWTRQYEGKADAPKDHGGIGFGMGVDIYINDYRFGDEEITATVSIGGIAAHDPDIADLRIAAYQEATCIARQLNTLFKIGQDAKQAVAFIARQYKENGRLA